MIPRSVHLPDSPRRSGMVLLAVALGAMPLMGQGPTPLPSSGAARHPVTFSSVGAIRELADGRVIVLDRVEKALSVVDFRAGTARRVGSTGEGPQEYRTPALLFPLAGDSTLVVDYQLGRWILFAGDRPVATIPPKSPAMGRTSGMVTGADQIGTTVFHATPTGLGRAIDQGDSLYLTRVVRATGAIDTLTRLRSGYGGPAGSSTRATPEVALEYVPGNAREFMLHPIIEDHAVVFPDGWIAVARVAPYRVDWIDPRKQVRRGAALPFTPTRLTEAEKRFYLAELARKDGKPAGSPASVKDWLTEYPPFWGSGDPGFFAAPSGALIILRVPTVALPTATYDVVNRAGVRTAQVALAAGERIVGFGAKDVYVVKADADGVEQLQRRPWPF